MPFVFFIYQVYEFSSYLITNHWFIHCAEFCKAAAFAYFFYNYCFVYSQRQRAPLTWTFSDLITPNYGISIHSSKIP